MRAAPRIPGFHYVGSGDDIAYVLDEPGEPFRIRIRQVTPRKWAVQVGGRTRFEVASRDEAVREARRLASELSSDDARVLEEGRALLSRGRATKKSSAQLQREIDEAIASDEGMRREMEGFAAARRWHDRHQRELRSKNPRVRAEAERREREIQRLDREITEALRRPKRTHATNISGAKIQSHATKSTKRPSYSVVEIFNLPGGRTHVKVERSGIPTYAEAKKIRERIADKRAVTYGARGAHYGVRKDRP